MVYRPADLARNEIHTNYSKSPKYTTHVVPVCMRRDEIFLMLDSINAKEVTSLTKQVFM